MELEQVYESMEDQQNMILDLVNNVVTERERELQRKNNLLRAKIEKLEQNMALEEAKRNFNMQQLYSNPPNAVKHKKVHYNQQYDNSADSEDSEDEEESEDSESEDASDSEDESTVA